VLTGRISEARTARRGVDMDEQRPEATRLEVPADPAYLRVARLTASAVGAVGGFDVARIEDLRIAVDELVGALIGGATPGATVVVTFRPGPDRLAITGTAPGDGPVVLESIAEQVVRAVAGRFTLEAAEGCITFSCTVHRKPC